MRLIRNRKAISPFILIVLLLISLIVGALFSYMWVLANFYLEPDSVNLFITEADFPVNHPDYFDITALNPSHSPSSVNITGISFALEGEQKLYEINETDPAPFPIYVARASAQKIRCFADWGPFAGSNIRVIVSTNTGSGGEITFLTKFVRLVLEPQFNPTASIKHFNLTVRNHVASQANLTLSKIYVNFQDPDRIINIPSGENASFPMSLPVNQTAAFECFYDWSGLVEPTVRVETLEGYYLERTIDVNSTVLITTSNITFSETSSDRFKVTVSNSADSSVPVIVNGITITYVNGTQFTVNGSLATPSFSPGYTLTKNSSVTFDCVWPWTNYRDQNVTLTVSAKAGFKSSPVTVKTPPSIVLKITGLSFNLTRTDYFLVNVTNMPTSLTSANITNIKFNTNQTIFTSQLVAPGAQAQFNCTFDWRNFRGKAATIAVTGSGQTVSQTLVLPVVDLRISGVSFGTTFEGLPYVNVTISNSIFSNTTVRLNRITLKVEGQTLSTVINNTLIIPQLLPEARLSIGVTATIVCPFWWTNPNLPSRNLLVTIETLEGYIVSATFQIP